MGVHAKRALPNETPVRLNGHRAAKELQNLLRRRWLNGPADGLSVQPIQQGQLLPARIGVLMDIKQVTHGTLGRTVVSRDLDIVPLITNRKDDGLVVKGVAAPEAGHVHAVRNGLDLL